MIPKKKTKYKLLYKKLIRLKTNTLTNSKFLKLKSIEKKIPRKNRPPLIRQRFIEVPKEKKKKMGGFRESSRKS